MDNCIIRINEVLDSLSKQELKVANYILKHAEDVSKMTVAELSKKCKSSAATIMRFCYSLNYSGYREFIKALYSDIQNKIHEDDSIYDIDNDDITGMSVSSTIYSVCKMNIRALDATLKVISTDEVEKAINLIDKANKVYIYALSGSKVVAYDAVFKFQRLGIDAQAYDDPHSQILSASILNKNDVAIVISYTGETIDILNTANLLKKKGTPIIAISKYGTNPLSKIADINIQHSSLGKGLKTYSTRSRTVQHNIIDILFVGLSQIRNNKLKEYYKLFSK